MRLERDACVQLNDAARQRHAQECPVRVGRGRNSCDDRTKTTAAYVVQWQVKVRMVEQVEQFVPAANFSHRTLSLPDESDLLASFFNANVKKPVQNFFPNIGFIHILYMCPDLNFGDVLVSREGDGIGSLWAAVTRLIHVRVGVSPIQAIPHTNAGGYGRVVEYRRIDL